MFGAEIPHQTASLKTLGVSCAEITQMKTIRKWIGFLKKFTKQKRESWNLEAEIWKAKSGKLESEKWKREKQKRESWNLKSGNLKSGSVKVGV